MRPPLRVLKSPADAEKLAGWVAMQVAKGAMDAARAGATVQALREFRQAHGDAQMKEEFEALKAIVAAQLAGKGP